jgi:hypothetical protein
VYSRNKEKKLKTASSWLFIERIMMHGSTTKFPHDGKHQTFKSINSLNAKLNPICLLLALLGAHYIFHVSGLRVNMTSYSILQTA